MALLDKVVTLEEEASEFGFRWETTDCRCSVEQPPKVGVGPRGAVEQPTHLSN